MKIIGLLLCLSLTGCYRVYQTYGDTLREGATAFFSLADCEAFIKKAAEIQPEVKRFCAKVAD